jgi:Protein of unknown function (DUF1232)
MIWLTTLYQRARQLKAETWALALAVRDPRTPWYAKLLVAGIVAYACSPIDLILDFVPVLGYLDDLVLLPPGYCLGYAVSPPCRVDRVSSTGTSNPPGWETCQLGGRRDHCRHMAGLCRVGSGVGRQDREKDGLLMRMHVRLLRRIRHMSWSQSQRLPGCGYGGALHDASTVYHR